MPSRSRRRRKHVPRHQHGNSLKGFERRCRTALSDMPGVTFLGEPPGLPKLSARLVELARPILEEAPTREAEKTAVGLTCLAWNLSMLSEEDREEELTRLLHAMGPEDPAGRLFFRQIIQEMIERKNETFPDDLRLVAHYELSYRGDRMNLQVASILDF